jgi:hypothetical protein
MNNKHHVRLSNASATSVVSLGHLRKVCTMGKVPKPRKSFHSYSLRRSKYYTCARTIIGSHRPSTNAIWVPKALLSDLYGPIPRWVPKCAN